MLEIQTTEHSHGGKRVQEEERRSQNSAFIDGIQNLNAAFVKQYRKLHDPPVGLCEHNRRKETAQAQRDKDPHNSKRLFFNYFRFQSFFNYSASY